MRSAVFLIVVGDSDTVHIRNNNNNNINNGGQQSRQLCSTIADTLFSYSRLFSWYSWAAWLLAGLLGFGSSSKDWERESGCPRSETSTIDYLQSHCVTKILYFFLPIRWPLRYWENHKWVGKSFLQHFPRSRCCQTLHLVGTCIEVRIEETS